MEIAKWRNFSFNNVLLPNNLRLAAVGSKKKEIEINNRET